jgi:hypothetical protein
MKADERRWVLVFLYLQVLDVLSTLIGFSLGNSEASPFVRLLIRFGPLAGLVLSKAVALGLLAACFAMKRMRLIRLINFWYAGLVIWNLYIVLSVLEGPVQARRATDPADAVRTIAAALRHNDSPIPNSGVFTAFRFASPANHANTGSYGNFLRLVKTADFTPMLHDNFEELSPVSVDGDHAAQTVRVQLKDGSSASYRFDVARQSSGGWMVDGVSRLP